jgi:hypothetical protein
MTETLSAQLGGYDAIAAVADNLLGRLRKRRARAGRSVRFSGNGS